MAGKERAVASGKRVLIRRPVASDAAEVLALARTSRRLHAAWVAPPATAAGFRAYLGKSRQRGSRSFLVCRRDDGAVVGACNLSQICHGDFRSAYLGYWVGARFARRGYMTEALGLVLAHAFGSLRLHRLEANIQPGNTGSLALVRRLGFEREGYSAGYLKVGGRWRDHERWAIRSETFAARPAAAPVPSASGPPPLSARFEEALAYAARIHSRQVRKGTPIPYLSHLLAVASLALEHGAGEDDAIAALLHDAIEDQGGREREADIRQRFGGRVADVVAACSDTDAQPRPPWRVRKEAYVARMRTAPEAVRLVSSADKLHNARAILADHRQIGPVLWRRFSGGRDGVLWYYRALVDAYRSSGTSPLVEELARVVSELEWRAGREEER